MADLHLVSTAFIAHASCKELAVSHTLNVALLGVQENPSIQTGGAATMGCKGVTKPYYFDDGLKEQKRFG